MVKRFRAGSRLVFRRLGSVGTISQQVHQTAATTSGDFQICTTNHSQTFEPVLLQSADLLSANWRQQDWSKRFWSENKQAFWRQSWTFGHFFSDEANFYFSDHINKENYIFRARKQPYEHMKKPLRKKQLYGVLPESMVSLTHTFLKDVDCHHVTVDSIMIIIIMFIEISVTKLL